MKTLILILTMLFISTVAIAQTDSDLELLFRADDFEEDGGNLFASGLVGLYSGDVPKLALKVSPPAPFELANTGAEIDAIHGGTFDSDISITGTAANRILLPQNGDDAATPTITFGSGNSGIYAWTDAIIAFSISGTRRYAFTGSAFNIYLTDAQLNFNNVLNLELSGDGLLFQGASEGYQFDTFIALDSLIIEAEKSFLADDGEIVLPTGVAGWGFAMIGDMQEYGHFVFKADGTVTLLTDVSGNTVAADTDAKFCIYDAGSGIAIKNRLGSGLKVAIDIHYYTP